MKCFCPIRLKRQGKFLDVPCGRCAACFVNKRQDWIFRLTEELKVSRNSYFVTLTYNDENLHLIKDEFDCSNVQKFIKNLRYELDRLGIKIKYFYCTERGDKSNRLHHHMLLFTDSSIEIGNYVSNEWKLGFVSLGQCNIKTIKYTTKYILKNEKRAYMSKGLGISFLTQEKKNFFREKGEFTIRTGGTNRILTRYYKEKIFTKDELELIRDHKIIKDEPVDDYKYLLEQQKAFARRVERLKKCKI